MTNTKLKIALFHELPFGGARRAVIEFGRQMDKYHDVHLYYIDEKREKNVENIFSNNTFIKFDKRSWHGNDWISKLYVDTIELLKLYFVHRKLAKIIDQERYDFIFIHGSKYTQAPFLLRFTKTKSVYYCQEPLRMVYEKEFDVPSSLSYPKKIYENLNRLNRKIVDKTNFKKADLVLANSKYTKSNIEAIYKKKAFVAYMGIDPKMFYPEKIAKKYDILFVGSRDEADGHQLLNDAIKLMKNKPKVRWLLREDEWIDNDNKLREIYSSSRVLVSLGRKEPFGLLPIEAQACGVAVVAVKDAGYLDTVIEGVSGSFTRRNAMDISKTITELLENDKERLKIAKMAVENVKRNWTWTANTSKLLDIVKSA